MKIRKAVIPAAGFGSRMLPVTKTVPKELLPVGGKPMIQYCVEEALQSGIEEIYIIINEDKRLIRDYFLEDGPEEIQDDRLIQNLRRLRGACRMGFMIQHQPKGLADALTIPRNVIGGECFAVLLPDSFCLAEKPILKQLLGKFDESKSLLMGLMKLGWREGHYFSISGEVLTHRIRGNLHRIRTLKKKKRGYFRLRQGRTIFRTFGRYVFSPEIFDYIEKARGKSLGVLDDRPVFEEVLKVKEIPAYLVQGKIFDVGNPRGYILANHYLLSRSKK